MTNDEGMTKPEFRSNAGRKRLCHSSFELPSSFVIHHSSFRGPVAPAFTIIELLIVIALIIVLAGLIFAISSFVQNKGRRARAEAEIAAMSAALENYKADNGIYPTDPAKTELVDPAISPPPAEASLFLYEKLAGDSNDDRVTDTTSYFSFKPNQLSPAEQTQTVAFIRDPFGNSYGYSTAKAANPAGAIGYNPTFDLWSTANETDPARWIKNW